MIASSRHHILLGGGRLGRNHRLTRIGMFSGAQTPLGHPLPRTLFRRTLRGHCFCALTAKGVSRECVPKQSLGTREREARRTRRKSSFSLWLRSVLSANAAVKNPGWHPNATGFSQPAAVHSQWPGVLDFQQEVRHEVLAVLVPLVAGVGRRTHGNDEPGTASGFCGHV